MLVYFQIMRIVNIFPPINSYGYNYRDFTDNCTPYFREIVHECDGLLTK